MHSREHLQKKTVEFDEAKAKLIAFLNTITHINCEQTTEDDPNRFEQYEALEENFRAALDFWAN